MEGFLTEYPAGDVDSHNIIYSWCAQTQVSMHSCESTSGYCREREIDRILLCTISDDDIPEGVTRKAILTSCVLVYVKKYEGQRSPIWLKNTCCVNTIPPIQKNGYGNYYVKTMATVKAMRTSVR